MLALPDPARTASRAELELAADAVLETAAPGELRRQYEAAVTLMRAPARYAAA
jgi:hypothetical protein